MLQRSVSGGCPAALGVRGMYPANRGEHFDRQRNRLYP